MADVTPAAAAVFLITFSDNAHKRTLNTNSRLVACPLSISSDELGREEVAFLVGALASVLLFQAVLVDHLQDILFEVAAPVNLDLRRCELIEHGTDNLPEAPDKPGDVDGEEPEHAAPVVLAHGGDDALEDGLGDLREADVREVEDHSPVLDLPRQQAVPNQEVDLEIGQVHQLLQVALKKYTCDLAVPCWRGGARH